MRTLWRLAVVPSLLVALTVSASSQETERQKVAEGQYMRIRNGRIVEGSRQSWVLWRLATGDHLVENTFHVANAAAELLVAVGVKHMSRELRRQTETELAQTALVAKLSLDHEVRSVEVKGHRLVDGRPVQVAGCESQGTQVRCKGANGGARLKTSNASRLLFGFPFPLLFRPFVLAVGTQEGAQASLKLMYLEILENRPSLTQAEGRIECVGEEAIQLGENEFQAYKYRLEVERQGKTSLKPTLWSSARGLVAALADEKNFPGERIALVQYKKYLDF